MIKHVSFYQTAKQLSRALLLLVLSAGTSQFSWAETSTPNVSATPVNNSVNSTVFPPLNQITAVEIQFAAQTVAAELNHLWWLRTGAYTALAGSAVYLYRAQQHSLAETKARQALQAAAQVADVNLAASEAGVRELEQKIGTLVLAERELLTAKITAELSAKQGAIAKAKQLGLVSLVAGGFNLVLEGAGAGLVQSVFRPTVKLLGPHNLSYYLYRTSLLEQLANLTNFMKYVGEGGQAVPTDSTVGNPDLAIIYQDMTALRAAMLTILGYLNLEQARLASQQAAANAQHNLAQQLTIQRLGSITSAMQRDFNQLLAQFQAYVGTKLAPLDYQKLGLALAQEYLTLRQQLELCGQLV